MGEVKIKEETNRIESSRSLKTNGEEVVSYLNYPEGGQFNWNDNHGDVIGVANQRYSIEG
jgi:hypothetical protein